MTASNEDSVLDPATTSQQYCNKMSAHLPVVNTRREANSLMRNIKFLMVIIANLSKMSVSISLL